MSTHTFTLDGTRQWIDGFGQCWSLVTNQLELYVLQRRDDGTQLTVRWITPAGHEKSGTVLLFLHGGGYIGGLGPEYPSPACVDDVITAYKWLLHDQRIAPEKIVFAGDSAGGGLSLLTLLALHDGEKIMSAWTDLSCERESVARNGTTDPVLSKEFAQWVAFQAADQQLMMHLLRAWDQVVPNMAHVFPLPYHHIAKGPKEKDPLDNIAAWVKEQLRP
ncbi:uncharacterized protein ACA1_002310 [Acanthamoeba castellanii str. Neff]|uniref:Alpha/beta hydrolase fold-3 domain-containing protein n=1 Tax=Acanthamoeba castellanii (strain ATCC 30010 / Neff) TaxID=1257118 RepID=L8GWK9_ACACF|nr:uncharacterized protein ACA1_002310 [Acanthamoeba castellanii str. Neff]ELR16481.1 hypothetical protein ACA1_002310 [Acanthamoeba castellanii str. Neff]